MIFKRFNIWMYVGVVLLLGLLTFCSYVACAALEEGASSTILIEVLALCFYICRFPTHTLFFEYLSGGGMFIETLVFNCFFNGFLVERLISIRFYISKD